MKFKKIIGGVLLFWGVMVLTPPYPDFSDGLLFLLFFKLFSYGLVKTAVFVYITGFVMAVIGAELMGVNLGKRIKKIFKSI